LSLVNIHPDEPCNVSERLRAQAQERGLERAIIDPRGLHPALHDKTREVTFAELEADVELLARGLVARGVQPGQRLALLVPPSIEMITLVFALLRSGAVAILIDPGMGKKNLVRCLSEAQPTGFIAIEKAQWLRRLLRHKFPLAKLNVTVGAPLLFAGFTLNQLREHGKQDVTLPTTLASDPAAIIFTSGSTGPAKGVLYRHRNFDSQVELIQKQYNIQPGEIDVPCFALFGLFNAAMGVTTVLPQMDFSRPAACDPKLIVEDAIGEHHATQSFASPAVWDKVGRYCEQEQIKFRHLRRVLSAGAPVRGDILERMALVLPDEAEMHTPYGATEALPVATISSREVLTETWAKTQQGAGVCVGRRFDQIEWRVVRISDGPLTTIVDTEELPRGEIGELIVRGPTVTTEYVTRTEANATSKIADPTGFWHRMGDAGYLDEQDRFWYCGRVSHRVVLAGRTLYTEQVEAVFNTVEGVRRTALVGVETRGVVLPIIMVEPISMPVPWWKSKQRAFSPLSDELLKLDFKLRSFAEKTFPRKIVFDDPALPNRMQESISSPFLFFYHPSLPVDVRHNAKIFREELQRWAQKKINGLPPYKPALGRIDS
jgi:acyl-CoA synthetase (AMP-forming)/AMP-acid ligase II